MGSSAIQGNIQTGEKFWDSPEVTGSAGRGILMLAQRWGGQALSYEDERVLWNFFPQLLCTAAALGHCILVPNILGEFACLKGVPGEKVWMDPREGLKRDWLRHFQKRLRAGGSWCEGVLRMPSSVCLHFPFTVYKHAVTRKLYWLKETYIKDFHQLL